MVVNEPEASTSGFFFFLFKKYIMVGLIQDLLILNLHFNQNTQVIFFFLYINYEKFFPRADVDIYHLSPSSA